MNKEQAQKEFIKYISNYDQTNPHIKRKRDHSLRVMQISEKIATEIGLNQEQINLASLIGLLHDIARFEQIKKYNTFKDSISFDHGDYAVKILTEDNYIRNYISDDKYDNIIKTAIKNHNKFQIEEGLQNEQLLYTKIIRDADKLDILYQGTYLSWLDIKSNIEKAQITPQEITSFIEKRTVNREKDLNHTDKFIKRVLITLGFPFDINFGISFQILKQTDYINKIINRFNFQNSQTRELMEQVRTIINDYINNHQ